MELLNEINELLDLANSTNKIAFIKGKRTRIKTKKKSVYGDAETSAADTNVAALTKARLYAQTPKANINLRKSQLARQLRSSIYN